MIRINDIKDDELRELAYKRMRESHGEEHEDFNKNKNTLLKGCFYFENTEEGHDFWWGVAIGNITKIL